MATLAAHQLSIAIGQRRLIRGLDATFEPGQIWAVLGANGSGKTSLLHTSAGLRAPAAGTVTLDRRALDAWSARQRAHRIALLLQDYEPEFPATVLDVALSGRHPYRKWLASHDAHDIALARSALAAVGLAGFESRPIATLSGGERRRAEIAAVLAQATPVRLLDEPANHLDLPHPTGDTRFVRRARARRDPHDHGAARHQSGAAFCDARAVAMRRRSPSTRSSGIDNYIGGIGQRLQLRIS